MKYVRLVMFALAAALVAGCGGGSSVTQDEHDDLQQQLEAAEEAKRQAEAAEAAALREAARLAEEARQAEQQRQQELADAEEQARQAEEERDEAQQKLDRFVALEIVNETPDDIAKGTIAVPQGSTVTVPTAITIPVPGLLYREPALVTVTGAQFTSTTTGSSSGWFKTTRSGSSEQRRDFAEIFSNVEAPAREDFRDHDLGSGLTYDANGRVLGTDNHIDITTAHGRLAASSRFPRPSTQRQGELETFTVTDRGPDQTQKTDAIAEKMRIDVLNSDADLTNNVVFDATNAHYDNYRLAVRNTERYPERYSIDISGTLYGAPGTFRCAGTTEGGTCTVDLSGPNNYVFGQTDAEWQFIPTSATSKVIIPDGQYMWFGWWMREPFETTPNADMAAEYDFASSYGGEGELDSVAGATGPATYEGAAIGHYAFYDIEAAENDRSRAGRFEAKATLIADFDTNTLSGSITDFDTEPTWSVTLKSRPIASGGVAAMDDSVSWSIRGLPRDGGQWEAKFYSNFVEPADTASPTGVAGAFTAQYGSNRKMIGAFGAERD